jgi:hypothetical protein
LFNEGLRIEDPAMANKPVHPDSDIVAYLLRRGAVSPTTAISVGELSQVAPATWRTLLMCGVVRESAPGVYYLADWPEERRAESRGRFVKSAAFWLLLIAIPVALLFISRLFISRIAPG